MFKLLKKLFTTEKPRTVQEVFNLTIDEGYYTEEEEVYSSYMCISLLYAYSYKLITKKEYVQNLCVIENYIGNTNPLVVYLTRNSLPHSFEDLLAIYKDWDNRPAINK